MDSKRTGISQSFALNLPVRKVRHFFTTKTRLGSLRPKEQKIGQKCGKPTFWYVPGIVDAATWHILKGHDLPRIVRLEARSPVGRPSKCLSGILVVEVPGSIPA